METRDVFKGWSNRKLFLMGWKFKILAHPISSKLGIKLTLMLLKWKMPIKWLLKPLLYTTFCGGENHSELNKTFKKLQMKGLGVIVDFAAEGEQSEMGFESSKNEVLKTIQLAKNQSGDRYCVVKCSALVNFELLEKKQKGLLFDELENKSWFDFLKRMETIAEECANNGVRLLVDAEESWGQTAISDVCKDLMIKYNRDEPLIFNTYQMYLKQNLAQLQRDIEWAKQNSIVLGVKLVRGAYLAKERNRATSLNLETPVYDSKTETDNAFDSAITICANSNRVSSIIASHNEKSCLMATKHYPKMFSFAQLYGMGDVLSHFLSHQGNNVYKYLPYGPFEKTIPYLLRRAEENQSIDGQVNRELYYIQKELLRRNLASQKVV